MRGTMTERILAAHLVEGELRPGAEVLLRVDQVLLQDVFGPQIFAQFEATGLDRVRVPLAAAYCDHMVYQFGSGNSDDHRYMRDAARRFGVHFAMPGTGICHQVHAERFGAAGTLLIGSDSHTVQGGGLGAFATGAGGQDILQALLGGGFRLRVPRPVRVTLTGELPGWVTAKDVNLELLRRLTTRGGLGRCLEFGGPGLASLTVQDRLTIANMAVELSATAAIFPSDDATREFLAAMGREGDFRPLAPAPHAEYEEEITVDLSALVPLVARPGRTDDVVPVDDAADVEVEQVVVGSCTNGSYEDLVRFALGLEACGGRVAEGVDAIVAPSSQAGLRQFLAEGHGARLLAAGARLSESTCGACLGVGHVPAEGSASARTFNRNFSGRSGLPHDRVYLVSPFTAAATAAAGRLADPRALAGGRPAPRVVTPARFPDAGAGLIAPAPRGAAALGDGASGGVASPGASSSGATPLRRPASLAAVPSLDRLPSGLRLRVACRVGDDVSTDDIQPANTIMLWRSDPRAAARTILRGLVPDLAQRCDAIAEGGMQAAIAAGDNYGQGSSREHAALGQRLLGVRMVVVRSFARIHRRNLVNFGVLPCLAEGEPPQEGAVLRVDDLAGQLRPAADGGFGTLRAVDEGSGRTVLLRHDLNELEVAIVRSGGLMNHVRDHPVQEMGESA